jgi:hypothetical protein
MNTSDVDGVAAVASWYPLQPKSGKYMIPVGSVLVKFSKKSGPSAVTASESSRTPVDAGAIT